MEINDYKIGYKCPMCNWIQADENINSITEKSINKDKIIKCTHCLNKILLSEWEIVKYPCIIEQDYIAIYYLKKFSNLFDTNLKKIKHFLMNKDINWDLKNLEDEKIDSIKVIIDDFYSINDEKWLLILNENLKKSYIKYEKQINYFYQTNNSKIIIYENIYHTIVNMIWNTHTYLEILYNKYKIMQA